MCNEYQFGNDIKNCQLRGLGVDPETRKTNVPRQLVFAEAR